MPVIKSGNWELSARKDRLHCLQKDAVGGEATYSFRFFFDEVLSATGNKYRKEYDFYINDERYSSICVRILPNEILHGLHDIRTDNMGSYGKWTKR